MSKKQLQLEVLEKLATLVTAGFGIVAALAWNSAIQDLFKRLTLFGTPDSLIAKFVYAFAVTMIVVVATYMIGKSVTTLKTDLGLIEKEPDDKHKT